MTAEEKKILIAQLGTFKASVATLLDRDKALLKETPKEKQHDLQISVYRLNNAMYDLQSVGDNLNKI